MNDKEEIFNLLAMVHAVLGLIALLLDNVLIAGMFGIFGAVSFVISMRYKEMNNDYETLPAESNAS